MSEWQAVHSLTLAATTIPPQRDCSAASSCDLIEPIIVPMNSRPILLASILVLPLTLPAADATLPTYRKLQLSDQFYSEGATFGDFNRDGKMDVVSGPYRYEGPEFKVRHEYYPAAAFDPLKYSDNFFVFAHDFNGDGWTDILV